MLMYMYVIDAIVQFIHTLTFTMTDLSTVAYSATMRSLVAVPLCQGQGLGHRATPAPTHHHPLSY